MENPFLIILRRLDDLKTELTKLRQQLPESKADTHDLIGISEASTLLGLKKSTLYSLTSKRGIPHFRRGKFLTFSIKALRQWQTEIAVPTIQEEKSKLRIGKGKH